MPDIIKRNPLNVVFGAYLKRERNTLRESTASISKKLKLGDSNYRMIEAGSAYLNPNKLALLASVFYESAILFERLSKFVVAVHVLEFELTSNTPLKQALQIIGERDEDLEYFIERTKNLYPLQFGSSEYKRVIAEVAIKELVNFLGGENYRTKNTMELNTDAQEILLSIPSIEVTNILKFLSSFKNRTPLHVGPTASEWEKNTPGLRRLRAVYRNQGLIISEENFKEFLYDYLFESEFENIRIIFMGDDLIAQDVRKNFIKGLQGARKKVGLHLLGEVEMQKITIKTVPVVSINDGQIEPFFKERVDIFPRLDGYWNFTNADGVEIGFVGGADDAKAKGYAINLSYRESLTRSKLFDILWDTI